MDNTAKWFYIDTDGADRAIVIAGHSLEGVRAESEQRFGYVSAHIREVPSDFFPIRIESTNWVADWLGTARMEPGGIGSAEFGIWRIQSRDTGRVIRVGDRRNVTSAELGRFDIEDLGVE